LLLRTPLPIRTLVALGMFLAYGAGAWLVVVHHAEGGHERSEPGLLLHALRDGTLALPAVLAAVWLGATFAPRLLDPERRLPDRWRIALVAAGAAVAAALVLAAGNPLHAALFETQDARDLPAALHYGRDALIALAAGLPVALLVTRPGLRRPAGAPTVAVAAAPAAGAEVTQDERRLLEVTRRGFVAAGGLTAAAIAGTTIPRSSAGAQTVAPTRLQLYINEGHVPMVDGTLVYMRGYGDALGTAARPSLTIAPTAFLKDGRGPLDGRHFPLGAQVPPEGCPSSAGVDPSGVGRHRILRRYWASLFPRRTIVAESGSEVRLRITNRLSGPHTFTVAGTAISHALAPGESRDVTFTAPAPGTYVFHDTMQAPVNRVLGLYGVLVVVPQANPWAFDAAGEGEFERQWLWILHDIDPEWGRRARMGAAIDPVATPSLPRYFTLNDRSGVFAVAHSPDAEENHRTHEDTKPCGHGRNVDVREFRGTGVAAGAGTGQLIRLVNTGVARHQPHFHGNHVWTIAIDNTTLSRSTPTIVGGHIRLQHWEDVVEIDPLETKAIMLPVKPPPDALDEVVASQRCDWVYPMHCHAEMSQTAGGGLYPGGQVSDWILRP
jgi:hypothetical protein